MNASKLFSSALSGFVAVAILGGCGGPAAMQSAVPAAKERPMFPSGGGSFRGSNADILGCPYPSGDVWEKDISGAQI
ncbi:MAG TPA: hypothetical protein VN909_06470, partial [Candidatus Dormibacteraeota bacterium]|nr:hypothetical protein [Candidatus Dormibacteraeota bacterium]